MIMNRLKASTAVKILAALLTTFSLAAVSLCLIGVFGLDAGGYYRIAKKDILKERYESVCEKYSIVALADYEKEFNKTLLSDTNFRYGVIAADNIEDVDVSDPSQYLVSNFEKMPKSQEDVYVYQAKIYEDTSFSYGTKIWDTFLIHSSMLNTGYEEAEHFHHGYYYNVTDENLYVRSENKLYLVPVKMVYGLEKLLESDRILNKYVKGYEPGNEKQNSDLFTWDDQIIGVTTEQGLYIGIEDIQITDQQGLALIGKISEQVVEQIEDDIFYTYIKKEVPSKSYIVVSNVQQPLQKTQGQSFFSGDLFEQETKLTEFIFQVRYLIIGILFVAGACLIATFLFLMSAAGHHKGQEGIVPRFLDKLPLDLYFAAVILAETILFLLIAAAANYSYSWNQPIGVEEHITFWIVLVFAGGAGCLLALAYCMSLAVNIKMGKWWQKTLVYRVLRACIKTFLTCVRFFFNFITELIRSVTLLWKVWLILGGIAIVQLILIGITANDPQALVVFWFLGKCIFYPILIFACLQMDKLQKSAQRIANGELSYRLDTDRMFWELKKHGDSLNAIRTGMNLAVNERLKSERFKTELITNVSHDIKTPLTSIINYIDLLQKEQIDNRTAQEYLEVLQRQSARLKKLIEDLIEASKASSGSLSVCMEQCDAGVMLIQTVGEFEEKLMQNEIILQITRPDQNLMIEADSRHLWRVFDNLMNNICKYAQPMTRAYVNLEQNEREAVIIFRNISKYPLNITSEELMERFVRGDSSRNTEGSGLGISIAKSLTELMDGTFSLSIDGDLFKVVLAFPLYGMRQEKDEREQPYQDSMQQEQTESSKGKWHETVASSIQQAGMYAKDISQEVTDKTGRAIHRAGRLAHHMKQAVQQTKDEAQAERRQQDEQKQDKWIQEQMKARMADNEPQMPSAPMPVDVQPETETIK